MSRDNEQFAEAKTKLPQRTLDLINEVLHSKDTTTYEYLQVCMSLVLRYAAPDAYWQSMSEPVQSALVYGLQAFLASPDAATVSAARQALGMQLGRCSDQVESVTITTHGGAVLTAQSPGLFSEFSSSVNDALLALVRADRPLSRMLDALQERHPDAQPIDIIYTALHDMLEVETGAAVGEYAANIYGSVPVRHPNKKL